MTVQEFKALLRVAAEYIKEKQSVLTEIDGKFGDGDHGITMSKVADVIMNGCSSGEQATISELCDDLSMDMFCINGGSASSLCTDYESLKAMFVGGHSYHAGPTPAHDVSNDYAILGISPDATDEEVKKAYRALAKKYHPDRVSHLGEDMKKQAEEKFNRLSDAYDNIKRSRGMK